MQPVGAADGGAEMTDEQAKELMFYVKAIWFVLVMLLVFVIARGTP